MNLIILSLFLQCNLNITQSIVSGYASTEECNISNQEILDSITIIGNFQNTNVIEADFRGFKDLIIIQEKAFMNCVNLAIIRIPESLIRIESQAFMGCKNLKGSFNFGNIYQLGSFAFHNCNNLEADLNLSSLSTIESGIFAYCYINFSKFSNIPWAAFFDCRCITGPAILTGVKLIASSDFQGYISLDCIIDLSSVTKIESFAFYHCDNLRGPVVFGEIGEINEYAFAFCSKLKGFVNATVLNEVISQCYCYEDFSYMPNHFVFSAFLRIDNNVFQSCMSIKGTLVFKNITSIGENAFRECANLTEIIISNDIKGWLNYSIL